MRAIDVHVHLHTTEADTARKDAQQVFGSSGSSADLLEYYTSRDMGAVIFDVDKETTTGQRIDNGAIAELAAKSGGRLIGFASVDPNKGAAALEELERCAALGLRGLKLQPITQQFHLADPRFYPLWEFCQAHNWPLLVHTGTTGIGAGSLGGRGLKLKYGHPLPDVDDVAADFPDLNIIAAHFAWPWHLDLLAIARHKANVWVDLSGWAPKYIPDEVVKYLNSVISDRVLFGSDYPWLNPDRWMAEFQQLPIKDEVREKVLLTNAQRLLGWDA
ncbi:amidohydrolase family protein [Micromonospora sp. U21]|uniref:amidohydrolase family protein n=1 Tax=Micromonospora sp. U21 TaxID=2824899 RepID=UPI001B36DC0B|nr:amidohydrolase family protein [Micromonospora sp. U21]MBQ0905012.1 amidohydrolase [Micromonospora sp. U21]